MSNEHPEWIDAHCHLADPRYSDAHLMDVIERSRIANIKGWVLGSASPFDWDRQLELQKRFGSGVITAFGLHPWWVANATEEEVDTNLDLLEKRGCEAQALGEVGLDALKAPLQNSSQLRAFESQLRIAKKLNKPLILHVVKSHSEALRELEKQAPFAKGGIIHSFSSSIEIAKSYLELGFLISIGGAVTKKGYLTLKAAISQLPFEKIVIETDAPDQTPCLPGISQSSLNEPANLIGIARVVAEFAKVNYVDMVTSSTRNLERLFGTNL